eukprot:275471-Karenia_brevis.AAC.1
MKSKRGKPIKKPSRFITSSESLAKGLASFKCNHRKGEHDLAQGSDTKRTEEYPARLCSKYLSSLFKSFECVPAMPVIRRSRAQPHRPRTKDLSLIHISEPTRH